MKLKYKTTDLAGKVITAEITDEKGRTYRWTRRAALKQWIVMPVVGPHGYGEGYWRTASKKAQAEAERLLVGLGLIESRHARHARIAREVVGL
jgi:hypothetical protein